jgi:hypothetical protein
MGVTAAILAQYGIPVGKALYAMAHKGSIAPPQNLYLPDLSSDTKNTLERLRLDILDKLTSCVKDWNISLETLYVAVEEAGRTLEDGFSTTSLLQNLATPFRLPTFWGAKRKHKLWEEAEMRDAHDHLLLETAKALITTLPDIPTFQNWEGIISLVRGINDREATTWVLGEILTYSSPQPDVQFYYDVVALAIAAQFPPTIHEASLEERRARVFPIDTPKKAGILEKVGYENAFPALQWEEGLSEEEQLMRIMGLRWSSTKAAYQKLKDYLRPDSPQRALYQLAQVFTANEFVEKGVEPLSLPAVAARFIEYPIYYKENLCELEARLRTHRRLQNPLTLSDAPLCSLEPLRQLKDIQCLNLRHLKINSLEPLRDLHLLRGLDVCETLVTSLEPLRNLKHLESLQLADTQVTDLEPIKELKNLRYLNLGSTQITNLEPLCDLKNLEHLYVHNTQVTNLEPIKELKNLTYLYLDGIPVSNLNLLTELKNLVSLSLSNTKVTDLEPITELKNLRYLYLDNTWVNSLEPIRELYGIKGLSLDNTQVTDLEPLKELKSLRHLSLDNTQVIKLEPIKELENLEHLSFDNTPISDADREWWENRQRNRR